MAIIGIVASIFFVHNVLEVASTPLFTSPFLSNAGAGRNIRHLPCVSLKTGETGVCMFAFNCVKANGTHLGTCLDRFYFGSCCKIGDNEPEIFHEDNTIDDSHSTASPLETNDIPDYLPKPKPDVVTQSPTKNAYTTIKTTSTTTALPSTSISTSTSISSSTSRNPIRTTSTTVPPSIALSTFQTIQDNKTPTRSPTTAAHTTPRSTTTKTTTSHQSRPTEPTSTERVATTQKISTFESKRPTKLPTTIPITSPSTFSTERLPERTTTEKTTERIPPATRFPPRNATTSRRPITTTKRPITISSTKKPTVVTKRPIRPSSTKPRPSTKPNSTQKPLNQTTLSTSTSVRPRPNATTSTLLTSRPTTTRPRPTKPTVKPTKTSTRPKPTTTATKPRPSSKPTRPTVVTIQTTVPVTTTTTTKAPSTTTTTKAPSTTTTTTTKAPSTTTSTKAPTTTSTTKAPSTTTTTTTTTTEEPVTLTNEILPPKVPNSEGVTTTTTTTGPGLVTWSSNSDQDLTSTTSSTTSSTTTTTSTTPEPVVSATETQWSPITTPDGWVIIQSPSTKKPEDVTKGTTAVPPTETTAQEPITSSKPTVPTVQLPTTTTSPKPTVTTSTPDQQRFNMSDYKQVCGRRLFPESRIVGGEKSSFGKWPWQISLRQFRTNQFLHKCGAALLNENWAITAAHCVEDVPPSDLLLRIGEHDLANDDEPYKYQERRVQIVASHPQFDPRTFEYDLALLRFYEPVLPFQPNLIPICIPDDDEGYVGQTAYVTGWGRLFEDGPLPSVLQEVSVPIINNTACEAMYRNAGFIEHIPHIFICAGWRKGGYDSCEGDSGGPMVIQRPRDKRWILAGVISWGIGCAEPNQPGVYTRISEFREWINQILQF